LTWASGRAEHPEEKAEAPLSRGPVIAFVLLLPLASLARGEETSLDCSRSVPEPERAHAQDSYRVGRDLVLAERWSEAEDPLTAATRLDPLLPEAHYALGQAVMALKRYPEAVAAFSRARDAFSCAASGPARREAERRLDEEMASIRDSLRGMEMERHKLSGVLWREMNRETPLTLAESGRLVQQVEAHLAELQRWRTRGGGPPPEVFLALGSAHFNAGAMEDAERAYRKALELDNHSGDAHNNLAVVLMLTSRPAEAEREVKLAEKAGIPVSPRLKDEIRKRKTAAATP
jgi:tetratricopeptide (TPR) repeat protein